MKIKKYKDYDEYKNVQISRTASKLKQDNIEKHKAILSWFLSDTVIKKSAKILCVGARAGNEISVLRSMGFRNIVGTDLYPNKDVIYDDMNNMQFKNNTFDLLYSHHSLEHTIYPTQAASEMMRVVKPGGFIFIVTPIMDSKRECECVSFDSYKEVRKLFNKAKMVKELFLPEKTETNNNPEYRVVFKNGRQAKRI